MRTALSLATSTSPPTTPLCESMPLTGPFLFCGYYGGLSGPGGFGSPAYEKAHAEFVRRWVAHLAELGVGYDGFAFYPVDEMGLHPGLVERYLRCAKLTKAADPNVRMYTDPAPGVTLEELKMTAPYTDIWLPERRVRVRRRMAPETGLHEVDRENLVDLRVFGVCQAPHAVGLLPGAGLVRLASRHDGGSGSGPTAPARTTRGSPHPPTPSTCSSTTAKASWPGKRWRGRSRRARGLRRARGAA